MVDRYPVHMPASVRGLTSRAVGVAVALAVLMALALAALLMTVSTMDEEAEALERVGGQRMMAQRGAVLAAQLGQPGLAPGLRQRSVVELEQLADRMRVDARWLITHPDVPAEVASLYATAWDDEAGVMARYTALLWQVADGRATLSALNHREAMLFNEEAARRYQRHAAAEVAQLRLVALLAFGGLLAGLVVLFVAVLRPAIVTVRQQVRRQAALGDAIVQSGHGVLLLNGDGVVTFANSHAETLTDYGPGELVGLDLGRLLFSAYGEDSAETILELATQSSWRGDIRLLRRGGVMLWAEMVVSASTAEGQYLVILFDATQRREAQAKLRQARERLSSAIEAVDDGFILFDAEERMLLCNQRFVALFPQLEPWLSPGVTMATLLEQMVKLRLVETEVSPENFIALRLAQFRAGQGQAELRLTDGRVLRCVDRRTPEGGRVSALADVTESIAARDQLRRALDNAEAAYHAKAVFLSSMSHELRTPLNAIVGFAQLLEGTPDGQFGSKQRRSVAHILDAGRHLAELIDRVLELADLQDGKLPLTVRRFDLAAVALDCISQMAATLHERQIAFAVRGCDHVVPALGDANRMAEVIGHLLSNAAKFNHPGGHVELSVAARGGGAVRLTVADSGPGIPADKRDQLFQPFNRLGNEGAAIHGSGIGLTIARALVQQMGGSIGHQDRDGGGSIFWVELPGGDVAEQGLRLVAG